MLEVLGLIISLMIILIGCELFTNGIEWMGMKFRLGDGVIGSIFSAVGTCLPETIVPIVAIIQNQSGINNNGANDIGIGAILGAPFMLSTLAMFVSGIAIILFKNKRKTGYNLKINISMLKRDLNFFVIVFSLGIASTLIQNYTVRNMISIVLIIIYIYYVVITVRKDSVSKEEVARLYLMRVTNIEAKLPVVLFQLSLAIFGIVFGSHLFVNNIEMLSNNIGISALILSLIITPIATELPEKFNSVLWISKNKDNLALANISGAMVFQSCIPVSVGITFTSWELNPTMLASSLLAIASTIFILTWIKIKKKLNPFPLLLGGAFYAIFIFIIYRNGFR